MVTFLKAHRRKDKNQLPETTSEKREVGAQAVELCTSIETGPLQKPAVHTNFIDIMSSLFATPSLYLCAPSEAG